MLIKRTKHGSRVLHRVQDDKVLGNTKTYPPHVILSDSEEPLTYANEAI